MGAGGGAAMGPTPGGGPAMGGAPGGGAPGPEGAPWVKLSGPLTGAEGVGGAGGGGGGVGPAAAPVTAVLAAICHPISPDRTGGSASVRGWDPAAGAGRIPGAPTAAVPVQGPGSRGGRGQSR